MQNEMIERVARAIFNIPADEPLSRPSRLAAERAIEAMRTPTEAMVEAGADNNHGGRYTCLPAWQAMIDACLTPP